MFIYILFIILIISLLWAFWSLYGLYRNAKVEKAVKDKLKQSRVLFQRTDVPSYDSSKASSLSDEDS